MSDNRIRPADLVPLGTVGTCAYCDIPVVVEDQQPIGSLAAEAYTDPCNPDSLRDGWSVVEVDHVTPRCQGGADTPENTVPSCTSCNRSKGGRTPDQWRGR